MQKKFYSKLFGVVLTVLMLMQPMTPCFALLSGDTGEVLPGQGMMVFDENGFTINSYFDMGSSISKMSVEYAGMGPLSRVP